MTAYPPLPLTTTPPQSWGDVYVRDDAGRWWIRPAHGSEWRDLQQHVNDRLRERMLNRTHSPVF